MNAPFFRTRTATEAAALKRTRAKEALWKRFQREAEGKSLMERLRLSHAYQEHLDAIEGEYRRDMQRVLHRAMVSA